MNKGAAIQLNKRWSNETQVEIDVLEAQMARLQKRKASFEEHIVVLEEEEVKEQ